MFLNVHNYHAEKDAHSTDKDSLYTLLINKRRFSSSKNKEKKVKEDQSTQVYLILKWIRKITYMVDPLDDCAGAWACSCARAWAKRLSIRRLSRSVPTGWAFRAMPFPEVMVVLKLNLTSISQCCMGRRVQAWDNKVKFYNRGNAMNVVKVDHWAK